MSGRAGTPSFDYRNIGRRAIFPWAWGLRKGRTGRSGTMREEATMCFVHSGSAGGVGLVQQAALGTAAAAAFSSVAAGGGMMGDGEVGGGLDVAGSGTPDVVAG